MSKVRDEWRRRWHVRVHFYWVRRPYVGLKVWRNDRNGVSVQYSYGHWRGVLRNARQWDRRQILEWEKSREQYARERELIQRWAA